MITFERICNSVKIRMKDALSLMRCWRPHQRWLFQNRHLRMDANEDVYDKRRRDFHKDRYEFAVSYVNNNALGPARVMDAACGTGYGSDILKRIKPASILGVDICPKAIEYAGNKYADGLCSFIVSNVTYLKEITDTSIDLVVSFETIEHVHNPLLLLENVARVLKPNGTLIISTPNEWGPTKDHVVDYSYDLFIEHLETYFVVLDTFVQNSGCLDLWINRGAPRRIEKVTAENQSEAECYIAICRRR